VIITTTTNYLHFEIAAIYFKIWKLNDDLSAIVLQTACALVQTTCSSLSVLFFAAWTHDIFYKVGGGIVLSEALAACGLDLEWYGRLLPQEVSFKSWEIFF
jgi:hypothetical protein